MSVTKVTGMMQTSTKGGDISSASPTVIDTDGDYFDVTGTTSFAAFTVVAGRRFTIQFDGALTMTHHATTLDLPGAANITTAAGDVAEFFATGTNTVQCVNYTKADGTAVVAGGGAWNIIGTTTASNSATLDITGLSATYKTYAIALNDLLPSQDADFELRLGDSSGIDSGSSDYAYHNPFYTAGTTDQQGSKTAATANSIKLGCTTAGADTGEGLGGMLFLDNTVVSYPRLYGNLNFRTHVAANSCNPVYGMRLAVITVDRIQVYPSGGTVESGRLTVWGLAHA